MLIEEQGELSEASVAGEHRDEILKPQAVKLVQKLFKI